MPLKIIVRENGPFAVDLSTGDLQLVDHLGNDITLPTPKPGKTTISLCRCGLSATKPFCDSTHKRTEWKGANPVSIEAAPSSEPPRPA